MSRSSKILAVMCLAFACAEVCLAQEMRVPDSLAAGDSAGISTTGSGKATFYLSGPGVSQKSDVALGEEIRLKPNDLRNAGFYQAILCADTCHSASFYVAAAKAASRAAASA